MTTKQKKADELVERFKPLCDDRFYNDGGVRRDESQRTKNAIQCAIICVEEKLEEAKLWHETTSYEETTDYEGGVKRISELQSVLNELKSRL